MKVLNLQFKHNYLFLGGTSYMFRLKYLADYGKNEKKFTDFLLFSNQLGGGHIF